MLRNINPDLTNQRMRVQREDLRPNRTRDTTINCKKLRLSRDRVLTINHLTDDTSEACLRESAPSVFRVAPPRVNNPNISCSCSRYLWGVRDLLNLALQGTGTLRVLLHSANLMLCSRILLPGLNRKCVVRRRVSLSTSCIFFPAVGCFKVLSTFCSSVLVCDLRQ